MYSWYVRLILWFWGYRLIWVSTYLGQPLEINTSTQYIKYKKIIYEVDEVIHTKLWVKYKPSIQYTEGLRIAECQAVRPVYLKRDHAKAYKNHKLFLR